MVSVWRCDDDGALVVVVVWRPPESLVSTLNLLSFPLFSLFFPSRYNARNPGVGFAGPGKYAPDKGDPPAVESLFRSRPLFLSLSIFLSPSFYLSFSLQRLPEAPVTTVSFRRRTCRFYRRGGIPVPFTGRRAGKWPTDFSIGLSAE